MATAAPTPETLETVTKPVAQKSQSLWGRALRRFARNRMAMFGLVLCIAVILLAILAPKLAALDPNKQWTDGTSDIGGPLAPGGKYHLGTDDLGRDVLSRLIWGSRISLTIGALATCVSSVVGIILGVIAGTLGGLVDMVIMRLTDMWLGLPVLLLYIFMGAALKPSPMLLYTVVGLFGWAGVARIARGQAIAASKNVYVEAAQAMGAKRMRIVFRHVLPNILGPVLVYSTLAVAQYILLEAALSFLGIGIQPPTADWGAMVSEGAKYFRIAWWLWVLPGAMIAITTLGFNLVGDGLDDALNPRAQD